MLHAYNQAPVSVKKTAPLPQATVGLVSDFGPDDLTYYPSFKIFLHEGSLRGGIFHRLI